ncbi:MAG: zinc ribbon domain-containing protein [Pirellulaceae bacterium]
MESTTSQTDAKNSNIVGFIKFIAYAVILTVILVTLLSGYLLRQNAAYHDAIEEDVQEARCPRCGRANAITARICPRCETRLAP